MLRKKKNAKFMHTGTGEVGSLLVALLIVYLRPLLRELRLYQSESPVLFTYI